MCVYKHHLWTFNTYSFLRPQLLMFKIAYTPQSLSTFFIFYPQYTKNTCLSQSQSIHL